MGNIYRLNVDYTLADQVVGDNGKVAFIPSFKQVDATGATIGGALPAGTDRSGSITTGGTVQTVAAANTSRRGLTFQNTSDTEMRVTEITAQTPSATVGYQVAPGGRFTASTNQQIKVFCATTGKTFAATEW